MALTDKLSAIGNAIREKTGSTALMTLDAMPAAIASIQTGGGSEDCNGLHIPDSALTLSGSLTQKFANNGWNWYIETVGNRMVTSNLQSLENAFTNSSTLKSIPFALNFATGTYNSHNYAFSGCLALTEIGDFNNCHFESTSNMFNKCNKLRYLPNFNNCSFTKLQNATDWQYDCNYMFSSCYSLRSIPESLLFEIHQANKASDYGNFFEGAFNLCYTLDEIRGLNPAGIGWTTNHFNSTFHRCSRLQHLTFAVQADGTPYTTEWSNQTIDLTNNVGWAYSNSHITGYNSGITSATRIMDDTSYHERKDNPDRWTSSANYALYDHDSAVETINSLPDTSAYLATAGGTNTIKFRAQGYKSIAYLTAEEIAVATAKGWTVSI